MAATAVLEYNVAQSAWEVRDHLGSSGSALGWHVAHVRDGGAEAHALYQASSAGNVYEAESDDLDDEGVAIPITALSKRYDCGALAMAHSLYVRLEAVTDSLDFLVTLGGSEYGETAYTYTQAFSGSDDLEKRIRLHRELMGRWISVEVTGDVSNRPAIREMQVRVIPIRNGRVSS